MISRIFALAAVAVLLQGCGNGQGPLQALGTLERDRLELTAESNERIVEIAVHEGDHVAAGQVLLRQEAGEMEPRLAEARAAVAQSEHRLDELTRGPRAREIDEARASLAGAESGLVTQSREFDRVASLVERHLLSASELDQARARRDSARASRDQAAAQLKLLLEGTRPEQIDQARADLARQRAALAQLEVSAARYIVRATRAGRVEALPYKLGERPPAGAPVVVVLADGAPYARVYVPEPLRAGFKAGASVDVRVDGVRGVHRGTVRYVSAEASFTPYYALTQKDRGRLSYLAEVTLDGPALAAVPVGVPVQVTLPTGG